MSKPLVADVAVNMPIANSSESPGRIGNRSPHSMKTIASEIQKNAPPKWASR